MCAWVSMSHPSHGINHSLSRSSGSTWPMDAKAGTRRVAEQHAMPGRVPRVARAAAASRLATRQGCYKRLALGTKTARRTMTMMVTRQQAAHKILTWRSNVVEESSVVSRVAEGRGGDSWKPKETERGIAVSRLASPSGSSPSNSTAACSAGGGAWAPFCVALCCRCSCAAPWRRSSTRGSVDGVRRCVGIRGGLTLSYRQTVLYADYSPPPLTMNLMRVSLHSFNSY